MSAKWIPSDPHKLIERYEAGDSANKLARDNGVSPPTVRKVLQSLGVTTRGRLTKRPCSIEDCDELAIAREMCIKHYQRWRCHEQVRDTCSVQNCNEPMMARGWCNKHYSRWREWGDPEYYPPRLNDGICEIEDCDKPASIRSICGMHYQRWVNNGDPLIYRVHMSAPVFPIGEMPQTCVEDGCDLPTKSAGLCIKHYKRQHSWGNTKGGMRICPVCGDRKYRISAGHGMCKKCTRQIYPRGQSISAVAKNFWTERNCLLSGQAWFERTGRLPREKEWSTGERHKVVNLIPSTNTVLRKFHTWKAFMTALTAFIAEDSDAG